MNVRAYARLKYEQSDCSSVSGNILDNNITNSKLYRFSDG